MSVGIQDFGTFFSAVYGYDPFPWQSRLAKQVCNQGWPKCIDLPTASGKTSTIDVAVFVLACQADRPTHKRTVGRRVFFAVNRRVIVDEAFERAVKLARTLRDASDGIIKRVADALREVGSDPQIPLDVAELRGGIYRDRRWARSLTQPIIVATTADQLGSRLLFRGYGVSASMQPVHAALTACDSLLLLDEAHVTRAFAQTLQRIEKYRSQDHTAPPMCFMQMTATPTGELKEKDRFILDQNDLTHPKLKERQQVSKLAKLIKLGGRKSVVDEIVSRAAGCVSDTHKAIGIIVNRVQTARDTHASLLAKFPLRENGTRDADIHLVIGRMRPLDRDELTKQLRGIVGPERPAVLPRPCFVVATQCLEVGADYDFDALITECASIDALRQRFGRLNRKGRKIEARAAIVTTDATLKDEDPVYGHALKNTWDWLVKQNGDAVDLGISAFKVIWDTVPETDRAALLAPAPDAAVLLPAHLDALCQTAPQPIPSPDVSYFIHGPQRDNLEVQVCWRADLGDDLGLWPQIVSMLPPTSPECMTVPLRSLRHWMQQSPNAVVDADVAIQSEEDHQTAESSHHVLIWRGNNGSLTTSNPNDIRPGDTIVFSTSDANWNILGHIPDGIGFDQAEESTAKAHRLRVVRIHPALNRHDVPAALLKYATGEIETLTKARIRELLGIEKSAGFDETFYRDAAGKIGGLMLRFRSLLPADKDLAPSTCEDDDDALTDIGQPITLADHTRHVVDALDQALPKFHLNGVAASIHRAADLHDVGKADIRFQAMLLGSTPEEAALRPVLLGKSGQMNLSRDERQVQFSRAQLPVGFRHEMLSVQVVEHFRQHLVDPSVDGDLLLHVIAAHHGQARPFAPVVVDALAEDVAEVTVNNLTLTTDDRRKLIPSHRIDSGIAERFWTLTRRFGWWGLAYLESVLRLADQQASAAEQEGSK